MDNIIQDLDFKPTLETWENHESITYLFWGRRSIIGSPICCSFLHGFAHVSKVGLLHPIFSLQDIKTTLGLLPSREHVI